MKHTRVRIIRVNSPGTIFANLTPGSVHDIIQPPADYIKEWPNTADAVWVEGNPGPVRIFVSGSNKEADLI